MKTLYTIKEYAEHLNISSAAVYKKVDKLETIIYKNKNCILIENTVEKEVPQSPQLKGLEVEKKIEIKEVEKIVEKIKYIDNPEHLKTIEDLKSIVGTDLKISAGIGIGLFIITETILYFTR